MNKNQKRLRVSLRGASNELALEVPAGGYHNATKGSWQTRRIPRANGRGVVSASPRRNMHERILSNPDGGTATIHEPIDATRPVSFKNHGYLRDEYRQPKTVAA